MTKIFIVAPGNGVSGGPEVLHQLAHALNIPYERARVIYFPLERTYEVPEVFRRYNFRVATVDEVEPGSIVVLPETCAWLIGAFPTAHIYFWWLSVDNFFHAADRTRLANIIGGPRVGRINLWKVRRKAEFHLFQSEYARQFLESVDLSPTSRLGDYLADEYVQHARRPRNMIRDDLIVYNPAKGNQRAQAVLCALADNYGISPTVVPVCGMTREEICELLGRAKVYLDFGAHPGKDRLPREAVALGACIIVNRRGSAGNSVDIPIPVDFKVDDLAPDFPVVAAEKVRLSIENFERQVVFFDSYRKAIADEVAVFEDDARSIFPIGL